MSTKDKGFTAIKRNNFQKCRGGSLFRAELQKLFSKEYDSFIKVKLRNVTWFNGWVKSIVRWEIKLDHSLGLTGIQDQLFPLIILNKLFNL